MRSHLSLPTTSPRPTAKTMVHLTNYNSKHARTVGCVILVNHTMRCCHHPRVIYQRAPTDVRQLPINGYSQRNLPRPWMARGILTTDHTGCEVACATTLKGKKIILILVFHVLYIYFKIISRARVWYVMIQYQPRRAALIELTIIKLYNYILFFFRYWILDCKVWVDFLLPPTAEVLTKVIPLGFIRNACFLSDIYIVFFMVLLIKSIL